MHRSTLFYAGYSFWTKNPLSQHVRVVFSQFTLNAGRTFCVWMERPLSLVLKARFIRVAAVFSLIQAALIIAHAASSKTAKDATSNAGALQASGNAAVHWAFVAPQRPTVPL